MSPAIPDLLAGGRIRVELENRLIARRHEGSFDMEVVPALSFYVEGDSGRWPRKPTVGPIVATEEKGVGEADFADLLEAAARIMRVQLDNKAATA